MTKISRKKTEKAKKTAVERIEMLFAQASEMFSEDPSLSNRYVELARKIAMKNKVKLSSELKKRFCKKCHTYLVPSVNCRIRMHDKRVIYTCLICSHHMRYPYIEEQKAK